MGAADATTGVAKFQGNATVITAPSGQVLALVRGGGCSLVYLTGTYTNGTTLTYEQVGMTMDYEQILHNEAGLTTTADSVPAGCVDPTRGLGTRQATYAGKTTAGLSVFAGIFYNFMTGLNGLYVLTGTTEFTDSVLSFSKAGSLTSGDLNGDGNADLLVVNGMTGETGAQVFVLLGNPDGTFQTAVPYTVPGNASLSAVVDDFDGDGKQDVLVSSDTGEVSLLTGKGDGTLNAPKSFTPVAPVYPGGAQTPVPASNLISADLRGTGHRDVVASSGLVLLNDGSGHFTAAASAAFPVMQALTVGGPYLASGDINRDGKPDLVLATGRGIFTFAGKGDGSFSQGLAYATVNTDNYVSVTDLDGDGNPDIYIGDANGGVFRGDVSDANIAYALMGNGDGSFEGAPLAGTGDYNGINLADLNGDGNPDLVTSTGNGAYGVQFGNGKGAFTAGPSFTPLDTFTFTTSSETSAVTVTGASTVVPSAYAVADIDGDGKADLVFVQTNLAATNANQPGSPYTFTGSVLSVALGNGDGTFKTSVPVVFPQIAPASGFDSQLTIASLRVADFNKDGHADVIASYNEVAGGSSTPYQQGFAVLAGNGNGTFKAAPVLSPTFSSATPPTNASGVPTIASIADFNGDGLPDVAAISSSFAVVDGTGVKTTTAAAYVNKGGGAFGAGSTVASSAKLASLTVGDFDKDGKPDVALVGETSGGQGQLFVARGNGDGTFATPTILLQTGGDTVAAAGLAAADFDGDGSTDLLLVNPNGLSGVFYGKGDGTFRSVASGSTALPQDLVNLYVGSSAGTVAVDLNHDGYVDVLSGNAVLLNLYGKATTPPAPIATTTGLSASSQAITLGGSVTLTATIAVAAGSSGTPTGTVTFLDGTTTLGAGTLSAGVATFAAGSLAVGAHSLTAVYGGDTVFSGSTSAAVTITVSAPALVGTMTLVSASAVNGTAVVGTSVTFTGRVVALSGTAVPAGTVTFSDGATVLGTGTLSGGMATFSTSGLAVGTHSIVAAYGGSTTFAASTSGPIPQVITAVPASDFAITFAAGAVTVARGASVSTVLSVTPTGGFKQAVQLTVSGNPTYTTATLSPTSVASGDGVAAATSTLTLQASTTTIAAVNRMRGFEVAGILLPGLIALFGLGRRRRLPVRLLMVAVTSLMLGAMGCGHSKQTSGPISTTNTPTPGTYTLTVTGTAIVGTGTLTHTATYVVTIQ